MSTPGAITGETLKSAISLKIREHFQIVQGGNITYPLIYKEQMVQNFDKPCFFIWTLDVSWNKIGRNRYEGLYQMNVRYHPKDEDETKYQTLCNIAMNLCDCLELINVPISIDGEKEIKLPVRATGIEYKIVDDVLQFFSNYTVTSTRPIDGTSMQTLSHDSTIR